MFKPLQKTAYLHAVTCMFLGIASGFITVVEITITNYVTTRPMSANVMKLAVAGQAMSLVAPVSAAVLIVQIKRRARKATRGSGKYSDYANHFCACRGHAECTPNCSGLV